MDIVDRHTRSRMMSGIKGKNTKSELLIRKALFKKGYRYRLHDKNIPGRPDLVLKKFNAVVFINGCFWHHHHCHLFKWPKSHPTFWKEKIEATVLRDIQNQKKVLDSGWRYLVIWECALKGKTKIPLSKVVEDTETWLHSDIQNAEITGLSEE